MEMKMDLPQSHGDTEADIDKLTVCVRPKSTWDSC
jgi:hypothetical protein